MDFKALSDGSEHPQQHYSVSARRDEANAQVETLRHARGVAMLDGGEFDDAALRDAERQLDALNDIEAVQVARLREAAAQARKAHIAGLRSKLIKMHRHRLNAVDRAETAARDLAQALKHAREHGVEVEKLVKALGGRVPPGMTDSETDKRMSNRLTDALMPLIGLRRRYGNIVFHAPLAHERGDWKQGEEALTADMIASVTEGT